MSSIKFLTKDVNDENYIIANTAGAITNHLWKPLPNSNYYISICGRKTQSNWLYRFDNADKCPKCFYKSNADCSLADDKLEQRPIKLNRYEAMIVDRLMAVVKWNNHPIQNHLNQLFIDMECCDIQIFIDVIKRLNGGK